MEILLNDQREQMRCLLVILLEAFGVKKDLKEMTNKELKTELEMAICGGHKDLTCQKPDTRKMAILQVANFFGGGSATV